MDINKLRSFIRVHKDNMPIELRNNVVYKISCRNCGASYVGQTSKQNTIDRVPQSH